MVHKRGRDDENLDPSMPKSNLSEHHHRGQTDSQPQNDADLYRALKKTKLEPISSTSNIMNAAVVAAAASMASSEHTQHQSTLTEMTKETGTIDVQSMPGGSTPAPTPKLAVASNGFRINSFNIHRLLITCIMVAAKFTSDHFYSNARYAKVGGLSLLELNQLELEFLFTTRFELNVKVEELQKVGNSLLRFKNRELASQQTRPQQQYRSTQLDLQRTSLHGNTINTTSCVSSQDSQGLQQKKGRFSIPTPTSPRNGPMSDRTASTSSSSLPSISSSLSSSPSPSSSSSSLAVTSTAATVSSPITTTVIVVSGDRVQHPQLLSPPEEKHRWAESEVQVTEEHIDQTQERNRSSPQYSSG
ncbi:hypothetical protein BGZ80_003793 [Entomortierella chlamydospora]|uniref:Cyclin-dependent protein kinase complex component n=1 Tax=Entomortierella chlamydospora TaxID=101097 RepID=A0A9P6T398_9FUNG|nr:hypothetical protein BGZ80_003793 [Entomortierella chlamydospora]